MALNYDLTEVNADYKSDEGWAVANTLIRATLSVELGSITEKNWKEFYTRCYMIERIHGPFRHDGKRDVYVQPEEVKEFIGLSTNVCDTSNAKFKQRVDQRFRNATESILRNL